MEEETKAYQAASCILPPLKQKQQEWQGLMVVGSDCTAQPLCRTLLLSWEEPNKLLFCYGDYGAYQVIK